MNFDESWFVRNAFDASLCIFKNPVHLNILVKIM